MAYGTMLYEWDWAGAEASFRRAIAANPNYPTAHHWYADFLAGRGRLDEALEQMQEARRLEPLSLIINAELAWVYYLMQRPAEAAGQIRQALQLDPNFSHAHFIQGMILIQQRRPREAVASLEKAVQLGGFANHVSAALAAAYAAAGDSTAARRILEDFERRASREYVSAFSIAVIHTALGERRQGIDWLLRGIRTRDNLLTENFFDPLLDSLRSSSRYPEVLAGMGLTR